VRARVGRATTLQLDLVDERLNAEALDNSELRRACKISGQKLGEPALERLEGGVRAAEREWHDGDDICCSWCSRQPLLLSDLRFRRLHDFPALERSQTRFQRTTHATRAPKVDVRRVGLARCRHTALCPGRDADLERGCAVARVELHRL